MIRGYKDEDLSFVQENNFFVSLLNQYNNSIEKENVFTMTDEDGNIVGVLALEYHFTWYSECEELHKVTMNFVTKDNNKEVECKVCSCLKFDLSKEIPKYELPEGMSIEALNINGDEVGRFMEFSKEAINGTPDNVNEIWFMSGEPSYRIFVVKDKDKIVSTACMWKITEERCAVENIATLSEYRRRNLARCVINHVLKAQKEQGYKIGTLSVRGKNKEAIKLYLSLGFNLYYNQIEMQYR